MENIQLLIEALAFIEDNLTESIRTETIADHLYCSKSTIEKLSGTSTISVSGIISSGGV